MPEVLRQEWIETERGWGRRPDGFSLHKDRADLDAFVKAYWDKMPNSVPEEYSTPVGEPFLVSVNQTLSSLVSSGNGIRRYVPLSDEETMEGDEMTAGADIYPVQDEIEKMLNAARAEASSLQNLSGAFEHVLNEIDAHSNSFGYDIAINEAKPCIDASFRRVQILLAGAVGRATAYSVSLQAVKGKKTEAQ